MYRDHKSKISVHLTGCYCFNNRFPLLTHRPVLSEVHGLRLTINTPSPQIVLFEFCAQYNHIHRYSIHVETIAQKLIYNFVMDTSIPARWMWWTSGQPPVVIHTHTHTQYIYTTIMTTNYLPWDCAEPEEADTSWLCSTNNIHYPTLTKQHTNTITTDTNCTCLDGWGFPLRAGGT